MKYPPYQRAAIASRRNRRMRSTVPGGSGQPRAHSRLGRQESRWSGSGHGAVDRSVSQERSRSRRRCRSRGRRRPRRSGSRAASTALFVEISHEYCRTSTRRRRRSLRQRGRHTPRAARLPSSPCRDRGGASRAARGCSRPQRERSVRHVARASRLRPVGYRAKLRRPRGRVPFRSPLAAARSLPAARSRKRGWRGSWPRPPMTRLRSGLVGHEATRSARATSRLRS